MEMFLIVILLPELLMITLGLAFLIVSFVGNGDLAKLKLSFTMPKKSVKSQYWGCYAGVASGQLEESFKLPKIIKEKEAESMEVIWAYDAKK